MSLGRKSKCPGAGSTKSKRTDLTNEFMTNLIVNIEFTKEGPRLGLKKDRANLVLEGDDFQFLLDVIETIMMNDFDGPDGGIEVEDAPAEPQKKTAVIGQLSEGWHTV